MTYTKFFAMIATSTAVMFGLMYLNTYALGHVFFSETRLYMALVMGASMAFIMLAFMFGMYKSKIANFLILAGSIAVFGIALFLVRSQVTVKDSSWMSAMIPHHSIAVLTSERATINDVRAQELADGIIRSQRKEIKEMKWLLKDIDTNGIAASENQAQQRPVPNFEGSL